MEYIVGALLMFGALIAGNRLLREPVRQLQDSKIRYTQSYVYGLIAPMLQHIPDDTPSQPRQSRSFVEKSYVRVLVLEDSAYWIKDNALYTAKIIEGAVDKETTQKVDTMTMSKVELDRTMFIVEKLREGLDNDNGSAGKQ